jgi:hypothetical protein
LQHLGEDGRIILKVALKKKECEVDWIQLAEGRVQWVLLNMAGIF